MPVRSQRRRRLRETGSDRESATASLLRRGDLLAALILTAAVAAVGGAVLLLARGGGDGGGDAGPTATPAAPFSPVTPDETAIAALSRQTILALPQGKWPELYDSFDSDFQARCPRPDFEAAGEADAQAQGANLNLIGYVGLQELTIDGTSATAVIVGEVSGSSRYTIQAQFAKTGDAWKLAAAPGTQGCNAFSRLSG